MTEQREFEKYNFAFGNANTKFLSIHIYECFNYFFHMFYI